MRAKIDGLRVLKGGQGIATIYIDKDSMKEALDLNEQNVTVSLTYDTVVADPSESALFEDPLEQAQKSIQEALEYISVARTCGNKKEGE